MIAGLLFALTHTLAAIVCFGLARAVAGHREPWLRAFTALAAFPLVAVGVLIGTDALLPLTPSTLTGVLLVLAALSIWASRRSRRDRAGSSPAAISGAALERATATESWLRTSITT